MKLIYRKYIATLALVWAGCFVLFFFVYMIVLTPQKKAKTEVEKEIAEKKRIYNSALKASRQDTKIRLSQQLEHLKDGLKDFVVDFEDSTNLIFDISQIANEKKVGSFGIKAKDIRRGSTVPKCKYIYENHIDISFTAGFNQFATFLNALERNRPVLFVDEFKITRSDEDNSSHPVNMNLSVFVRKRQDS